MLSGIFSSILLKIKNKVNIEDYKIEKLLEYIQTKPINSYVYPEVVEERFGVSMQECMKLFIILEKKNILKQVYKLYCPKCQDFSDDVFEDINDLEEANQCDKCDKELYEEANPYKYVVVYFRVMRNE